MKNIKHLLGLVAIFALLFTSKTAYAQENPAFGTLNNTYKEFLTQIYNACAAGNMGLAKSFDGTDIANNLRDELRAAGIQDYYIIMDGTTDTGKGIGIHVSQRGGYGFYYGDYVGGKYEGNGTFFYNQGYDDPNGIYYYSYTGQWSNNLPNGVGEIRVAEMSYDNSSVINKLIQGTFLNGYANGEMRHSMIEAYHDYPILCLYNATAGKLSPSAVAVVNPALFYMISENPESVSSSDLISFDYIGIDGIRGVSYVVELFDFTSVYNTVPPIQEWELASGYKVYTISTTMNTWFNPNDPEDGPYSYYYVGCTSDYMLGVAMFMN